MPFIVDASIAAGWAFEENHPSAELAFERLLVESAVAPYLLWYEVRNLLIVRERKQRRNPGNTAEFLRLLATLPIVLDLNPDELAVLRLARAHKLTVYDAAYLELAERQGVPLATLDADLARAARAEKIPLLGARSRSGR